MLGMSVPRAPLRLPWADIERPFWAFKLRVCVQSGIPHRFALDWHNAYLQGSTLGIVRVAASLALGWYREPLRGFRQIDPDHFCMSAHSCVQTWIGYSNRSPQRSISDDMTKGHL